LQTKKIAKRRNAKRQPRTSPIARHELNANARKSTANIEK
jgi:hypothetical protein